MNNVVHIYASGPGLVFLSPKSKQSIFEGINTDDLINDQKIVFLDTGSPQLFYELRIHVECPPKIKDEKNLITTVEFGIQIEGNSLYIADGYAIEYSFSDDYDMKELNIPDDYYRVTCLYDHSLHREDSDMIIDLYLEKTEKRITSAEMVDLIYDPKIK